MRLSKSVIWHQCTPPNLLRQTESLTSAPCHTLRQKHASSCPPSVKKRHQRLQVVAAAVLDKAASSTARVETFAGLQGDDFRHPLDQQNTRLLRLLPGLELVAKNMLGPVAEQVLLLENIGTSLLVGPTQLASLHKLLVQATTTLHMKNVPDLYVRQNPVPNAYTLAIAGRRPFVVVHTALLELLEPAEVQAVIAHELGHLKCSHGVWLTIANLLASGALSLLPGLSDAVTEGLLRWLRAAELTCDRAALLVAQDPRIVVSALMKLAGGSPSLSKELNIDAFLEQARSYDEASSTLLGWYLRNAQTRALSHPLPVMRAREIDLWSRSPEYLRLLSRNQRRPKLPR
ncbi:hypothetical protein WJX73_002112 [Symbiochloris irregularis]|uniref:Peptidase M48 domain-containing protein n=1 Tax=Symbiochloris irregularis TaxID=706552 RepID=A0AAW1NNI1_9CHLO